MQPRAPEPACLPSSRPWRRRSGWRSTRSTCATLTRSSAPLSSGDISALQERLRDARCYTGAIDGTASAATDAALKRCPMMDPILSIETGIHTTDARIGTDRGCQLLATGSQDKTVRLWSLPDGKPLRTPRLPIGTGDEGKVNAVAVSPDGGLIAAGGWDAAWKDSEVDFPSA